MQIFRPGADSLIRVALLAAAILPIIAIGVTYAISSSPYITQQNVTRNQPVPFSHEHHVGGLGIDCRYCHTSVEKAQFAGLPPTETCMTCHSQIWTNAEMLAPVRKSLEEHRPIRWNRVHNLPGYVYFDHSVHVAKGVGCSTCHGPVEQMKLMRQAAPLTMGWCLNCHRDPKPALRPQQAVFDQSWKPPPNQEEQGNRLFQTYNIHPEHLTDCSVCHR